MKNLKKTYLIVFLITLTLLPTIILAQTEVEWFEPGGVLRIIFGPKIPEEWLHPLNILQFLVFPFILLWLIFFGILTEIRIFRRHSAINGLIALFIALIASYTGALVLFIHWTIVVAGFWGYTVFWVLLMVGIGVWFVMRMRGWGFRRWGFTTEIMEKEENLTRWRDYHRRCLEAGMTTEAEEARKKIETLEKRIGKLRKKKFPGERPPE